jgi:molybdenum cofactor biosynthesis protein B
MSYQQHRQDAQKITARCAVVTLSDTRTRESDVSGKRICEMVTAAGHVVSDYRVVTDDPQRLRTLIDRLLGDENVDVILTNGGTGISRRDQTIPVIEAAFETALPGFGELFRMLSWQQIGSGAMLSRAVAGITRKRLIFAMPGSTAAVELAMKDLILPELSHLLHEMRK